jgi:hypothetical protein
MDLTVLCPETGAESTDAIDAAANAAGIAHEAHKLSGDPRQALFRHLDHHHQIAFVVFNGSDGLLQNLTDDFARKPHGMRVHVPFVVVGESARA